MLKCHTIEQFQPKFPEYKNLPTDRSRPAVRRILSCLSALEALRREWMRTAARSCAALLAASPGWAPPLPLLAFAYVVVRRWLNMTDMRIETSQLLRKTVARQVASTAGAGR